MILYFTGTGNSRILAQVLGKQLQDSVIDITKHIKAKEHPVFSSEKPYVFVVPVYAWRIPKLVETWIEKCTFDGCKKVYFIINCGDSIGGAENYVKKLVKKKYMQYMGTAEVVMPENYIIMFPSPEEAEIPALIANGKKKAENVADFIQKEEVLEKGKVNLLGRIESDIVNFFFRTFYVGGKKFYAKETCIACGKCVKDCMLNNVTMKDGKSVWGKNCTHCMACIGKCPVRAIEYGKNTKGKKPYFCSDEMQ